MKKAAALGLALLMLFLWGCQRNTPAPSTVPTTETTQPTQAPETRPSLAEGIFISEIMADNKTLAMGHDRDWVELYNRGESEASLAGYWLTDDPQDPYKLSLEQLRIPAGGYLVIELGEDAPFRLSAQGETVYLLAGKDLADSVTFGLSESGESFDAAGVCLYPTPGFANTQEGYLEYLRQLTLPGLIINEVLSSNDSYPAPDGKCYDYIEVANISDAPISLGSFTLSDKGSEPDRYRFPDVTLAPGELYTVYCSDDATLGTDHAPFKISASGETVYLSKDGSFTDVLTVPGGLKADESFGRDGKIPSYLLTPTPGAENSQGFLTGVSVPTASLPSGVYSEPVTVTLEADGTVYYTLDGSRPTESSAVYTQPLMLEGVTTVRTFCVNGDRSSAITAYTYLVGVEHSLPIVTVAIPEKNLTGSRGVLNNLEVEYEHEAVLTLIEDGEEKFSVPFGFRLHGNDSRKMAKQNFSLRFRSEYGVGKLKYKVFEDRDIDEFNSLLLKGGSEDWYRANLRDELSTAIADGTTNLYTQALKPVVLYLGGEYWGIYYLRERVSADYVASHLNVSKESVDLLYSTNAYVQSGSDAEFKAIKDYVRTHDMSKSENYAWVADRIDVLSLMDWYICRAYGSDGDYANIRRFRSDEADGKWHWVYFDLDWSLDYPAEKPFSKMLSNLNGEPLLMNALLKSKEGRDTFLKRCAQLMKTTLSEEHYLEVLDGIVEQIRPEIAKDRARWKQSVEGWEKELQKIRNFVSGTAQIDRMKQDLRNRFSLTAEEMEYYFG